jgi:hypothetical protein
VIKPETPIKKASRLFLNESGFSCTSEQANFFILEKGFKPVFFVRNPLTRLASGFIDKFICRRGLPLSYPDNFEQLIINTITDLYDVSDYAGDYKGVSFVDLIEYIATCVKTERALDHHWMPQISGISQELQNQILSGHCFVVKQESFKHDLKNINFALGYSYLPPQMNVSRMPKTWSAVPQKTDYSSVSNQLIVESKIRIAKENLLTNATKSAISRIYQDDFKLFSYALVKGNHQKMLAEK